ncbi:MAG: hypothetical protein GY910_04770 [bacterium]|nr:hypothetical protein [Deltaproteobacteria bacterium]MCP4904274.1 hypothetical protein [bacterium]
MSGICSGYATHRQLPSLATSGGGPAPLGDLARHLREVGVDRLIRGQIPSNRRRESTTDPHLSQRVRRHSEARVFSPALVDRLCAEIDRRSGDAGIEIAKGWWVSVGRLLEAFEPLDQSTRHAILHPAPAAILAFSFGYRLESPFARFPEQRKPGPNNFSLAAMTERCKRLFPDA